jgi:hypothetical protein
MVAWQPDPNLPPHDREDLYDAHYMRFTHELHKMGELAVGWADDVQFNPAWPETPVAPPVPITLMTERSVDATSGVEDRPSAA